MNYKKLFKTTLKKSFLVEIGSLLALLLLASAFKISVSQLEDRGGSSLATLAINFDGLNKNFEGEVTDDMTILDALNIAMAAGKIKLHYVLDENNKTRVTEIDGHINDGMRGEFTFYLNDKKVPAEKLNETELEAGDSVVIKYESR